MAVKQAQEEMTGPPGLPGYGRAILQGAGKGSLRGAALGAFGRGMFSLGVAGGAGMSDIDALKFSLPNAGIGGALGFAAGAGLGALKGGVSTALERRRLQNAAAAQQAKQAGITDYIPGWANLNMAHLIHIDAQGLAGQNKKLNNPLLQDLVDKKRAAAIQELGIGGAKLLGTGLAVGGAAYGAKKLYNHMTNNNKAQEKVSSLMMKYAQEELATSPQLPGYGRNALRGAAVGGLIGGVPAATLGALWGHNWTTDKSAPLGAAILGTPAALGGAAFGGLTGLGITALQRRALAKQEAAKQAAYEFAKLAQEEEAAQNLPGYGRNALRGAALGALAAGIPVAALGGIAGYNSSNSNAPVGAAILGGPAALAGAVGGGMAGLGITALERRRLRNMEAAKVAGAASRASRAAIGMGRGPEAKAEYRLYLGQTMSPSKIDALVDAGDADTLRRATWNQDTAAARGLYKLEQMRSNGASNIPGGASSIPDVASIPGGGGVPTWAKVLGGTALAAGAAYGGKKLYDRYKAKQQAKEAAALPPSLGGEIGKHLLLAGAATLGGIAVQKGFSAASSALDRLEKPKNLARMMAVAPELRAIDPQMLSLAYDSIAAISPKLVKDPLVGASVLRKHVQTTDLNALRSAADLYRSPDPAVGSLVGSALTRAADKGYGSYEKKLETFNNPKKP